MKLLLVSLALASSAGAVVFGQATFKDANRTVAVYATITEVGGRLVPDLDRTAFHIEDNGKLQALTIFANDVQPITVVMMLDRSTSMRGNFERVQEAAEQFVNALQPGDTARIGSFSNRIQVDPREFTSNHAELIGILQRELQDEGPTPLWNAVNVGITALLHQEGRRVVLVFTDGADAPLNATPSNSSLKSVMKRAEEEDVMVYAVGLSGNTGGPARGVGGGAGRGVPGGGGGGGRGQFGGWAGGQRGPGGLDRPDPGLARLAMDTGGGYFELTDTADLGATFTRVAEELHHQYLLGFSPTVLDGKIHRIAVGVQDARWTVRARKSYLAATER